MVRERATGRERERERENEKELRHRKERKTISLFQLKIDSIPLDGFLHPVQFFQVRLEQGWF